MNDAEYEAAKRKVERAFFKWRRLLGFVYWHCEIVYSRDGLASDDTLRKTCAAKIVSDWRYMQLCLTANMPYLGGLTDDQIEDVIAHEFSHAVVNELREERADWLDHEERVCTHLGFALVGIWRKAQYPKDFEEWIDADLEAREENGL